MTGPENARLAGFARNCVTTGDMTPMAERMMLQIINEMTENKGRQDDWRKQ